jgi:hypothetical protein
VAASGDLMGRRRCLSECDLVRLLAGHGQAEYQARGRPLTLPVLRRLISTRLPGAVRYALHAEQVAGGYRVTLSRRSLVTLGARGEICWAQPAIPTNTPAYGSSEFQHGVRAFRLAVFAVAQTRKRVLLQAVGSRRIPRRRCARSRRSPRTRRASTARDDGPGKPKPGRARFAESQAAKRRNDPWVESYVLGGSDYGRRTT